MQNTEEMFHRISEINEAHGLPVDGIQEKLLEFRNQKVTIPIIGKFSVGKTALLNTLLGYGHKLLREDITPETAVPTELSYSEADEVVITSPEGVRQLSLREFETGTFDYAHITAVSIRISNNFLKLIPDVMLVDMPGFDSGYEVHNQAINRYLPKSLAYMIAFSAEDMTLKSNLISVLKELVLNDMHLCIVITKSEKVTEEILEKNIAKLKTDLEKHIGLKEVRICKTSSFLGETEDIREFLLGIQEQSADIIDHRYKKVIFQLASAAEIFLNSLVQNQSLTLSELAEKEARLKQELADLGGCVSSESDVFDSMIPGCIQEIKGDLLNALNAEESSLASMMLDGQDIGERVNSVVRLTITKSLKERFIPKLQKHMDSITSHINTLVSADAGFACSDLSVDKNLLPETIINVSLAAIGLVVLGPLLTLIGGVVALFIGNSQKEKKREAQRAQVSHKLRGEVFPRVLEQVGAQLDIELRRSSETISKALAEEINHQYENLNSALLEVTEKRELETEEKNRFLGAVTTELEEMRGIKHECQ